MQLIYHLRAKFTLRFLSSTIIFPVAQQLNLGIGGHIVEVYISHTFRHTHTHTQPVRLLWTSDQLVTEAITYTTHNKQGDLHPFPQRTSNPQIQQSSDCRPMP
jgi:hypothetical protein